MNVSVLKGYRTFALNRSDAEETHTLMWFYSTDKTPHQLNESVALILLCLLRCLVTLLAGS